MREIHNYKDIKLFELIKVGEIENLETVEGARELVSLFHGNPDQFTIQEFWDAFWNLTAILYQKPEPKQITSFTLNGVEYHAKTAEELTAGEFIDFDTLSREKPIENTLTLLAIVFTDGTPDGDYVNAVQERMKKFETLDAETAISALSFIQAALVSCVRVMLGSLDKAAGSKNEMVRKLIADLKDGDGKSLFGESLAGMSR